LERGWVQAVRKKIVSQRLKRAIIFIIEKSPNPYTSILSPTGKTTTKTGIGGRDGVEENTGGNKHFLAKSRANIGFSRKPGIGVHLLRKIVFFLKTDREALPF
jgi:hypothetical protein